ncbi:MAG: hypothetical protein RL654_2639 [Pseudomonadota bacterium]
MTFDAIKLNGRWVPCDFMDHSEPIVPAPGPNGLKLQQRNTANVLVFIPDLMSEVEHLRGPHEVRRDGRIGVFVHMNMRRDGLLGYIDYARTAP